MLTRDLRRARRWALRLPPLAGLVADRDLWRERAQARERELIELRANSEPQAPESQVTVRQAHPPGHFYSPIPDLDDIASRESQIFDRTRTEVPGIDMRSADQLGLLPGFAAFYEEQPFTEQPADGRRYGFENDFFSYGDGLALYGMLRHLRPRRMIEVGSGWSSALALDVNDLFLDQAMECTFIEPYPDRLLELLRPADHDRVTVLERPLHAVPDSTFADLAAGDLLFIDSTHVSRVGSDVNRLLLDVIPALPAGVMVHVHDVFWPFEYPEQWVYEGRAWNENYLLRALLIDNARLQIVWFNGYLARMHPELVEKAMPLWRRNTGGSIYFTTA